MQEFITQMYVKQLLQHWTFQLLLATLLVINAITVALRTNFVLGQKHYEFFATIDDIVLTILICEVLLGWLNGFWVFWKDGWNILNFLIIFILLLGFFISELNVISITYTLRVLRLVHVCMSVEPLARIIRVILQSVPDMANIMALILFFMLVFSVFGVTLFGAFVPKHFQNMQVALYTLFICITQDGWVDIYNDFQIVEEVRSIRFNQEQEEELLQRHLSVQSMESKSSMDLHEMTSQQDLITALVHREKVQESTTNLPKRKKSSR